MRTTWRSPLPWRAAISWRGLARPLARNPRATVRCLAGNARVAAGPRQTVIAWPAARVAARALVIRWPDGAA